MVVVVSGGVGEGEGEIEGEGGGGGRDGGVGDETHEVANDGDGLAPVFAALPEAIVGGRVAEDEEEGGDDAEHGHDRVREPKRLAVGDGRDGDKQREDGHGEQGAPDDGQDRALVAERVEEPEVPLGDRPQPALVAFARGHERLDTRVPGRRRL